MSFTGKTVVVTGGSGAVGRVASRRFVEAGARVVVADMAPPPDEAGAVVYHETNVLDEASVRGLFERVASEFGGPHALVNIAGGFRFGPSVEEMEESDWDSLLQLNLKSTFLTIKNVLPYMKAQDYGRIVSIAARSGLRGDPMVAHYSVSKGGVILLTQSVAAEVKAHDITVNAVLPSIIDTPANREAMPDAKAERWVQPDDLANVLLFLASEEARAVSGAAVPVYYKA
ncbi:MAG: SDR family NAD(P)-dependent oxidoreductase [Chloroflexota bacterium]|nr:SDR family NAD(P)-dependent oxidoreductase [Chloroflexota bacterium]MDE2885239.1 SDR family NAD(P)-dependent oxidoreductase [Chloroflexota bacterium]